MPHQGESGIGSHCRLKRRSGEFEKAACQGIFLLSEPSGITPGSQAIFRHMPNKIAHIEPRMTPAEKVEVKKVETVAIDQYLIVIKIPVNAAQR